MGTPRPSGSALEFTPIGRRRDGSSRNKSSPVPQRMTLNNEKINNTLVESTFDNTTEHFDTLQSLGNEGPIGKTHQNFKGFDLGGMFDSTFKSRLAIVNDGSNSIQDLQNENKELQAENYNLKIEVATLTKYLKQTPEENRNLAYENVELKQQLMKAMNELDGKASSTALDLAESLNSMRALYKEIIEEKDHEIHQLQLKNSELMQQIRNTSASDELLNKMEFLQTENQTLRRRLDDASNNDVDLAAVHEENNDLKSKLSNLERKLALIPLDTSAKVQNLSEENQFLEKKIESIQQELKDVEREQSSKESAIRQLRSQLEDKEDEVLRLRLEYKDVQTRSVNASKSNVRLQEATQESLELKSKLRRLETQNRDELADKEAQLHRLENKVKSLTKELHTKESYESELRNQIQSLLVERNSAFDNQSLLKHYQSQIETLQNKESTLTDANNELKDEIAKLQDELYSMSSESDRAAKLKEEIHELENKLDFYENEYSLLQDALENAELESESLKAKERGSDRKVHDLNREIDNLTSKLRRTELSESQKYNESALFELESVHKKREDAERSRLELQIDTLNEQIRKLEEELRRSKSSEPSTGEEYHKYLRERSKLQMELDDKDLQLEEQRRKYSKLENMIKDKDSLVEALESRIRDLNRDYRSNAFTEDSNKSEIYKIKSDFEFRLRTLQNENDKLQRDLEDQIRYYQTKLDVFMERERYDSVSNNSSSSMVALLESQLEEVRRLNKELSDKLTLAQTFNKSESDQLLSEYRTKLLDLQAKLVQAQADKLQLQETVDALELDTKILRSDKNRLEMRSRNLNQELSRASKHCAKLASKLNDMTMMESKNLNKNSDEILRLRRANVQLQGQIDQLNSKLTSAKFASLAKGDNRSSAETRLLRNELHYYKAKLFDLNMRANDLAVMNSFVMSSIKNSNQMIKNDIVKLTQCGIYPDYAEMKRKQGGEKITFKVLATFVLSMVRLKNRLEKAEDRRAKMQHLRGEIDRDKITLLAE